MMDNRPPRKGDVLLLVGTRKGAFVLSSDPGRRDWAITGPHHPGSDIFHLAYDGDGSGGAGPARFWQRKTT